MPSLLTGRSWVLPTDRESCDCKWCSRKWKLPGKVLRKLSLACHSLLKSLLDFDTEMPE